MKNTMLWASECSTSARCTTRGAAITVTLQKNKVRVLAVSLAREVLERSSFTDEDRLDIGVDPTCAHIAVIKMAGGPCRLVNKGAKTGRRGFSLMIRKEWRFKPDLAIKATHAVPIISKPGYLEIELTGEFKNAFV